MVRHSREREHRDINRQYGGRMRKKREMNGDKMRGRSGSDTTVSITSTEKNEKKQ